jgi:3,4-dihydroxy 2-butanone 4-phosphate synthase/GTP cyclohydrolase II
VYGESSIGKSDEEDSPMLVRVHTHCLAGDVFGTTLCDCRAVVDGSLRMIAEAGRGALVYLHNGTRGFGIDRTALAAAGTNAAPHRLLLHRDPRVETRPKDGCEEGTQRAQRTLRQVGLGGQILCDLGIHRIRLLTNTPTHVPALQGFGIEIVEQVRIPIGVHTRNEAACV